MISPKEKHSAVAYLSDMRNAFPAARKFSRGVTFEEFRTPREKQFSIIHALEIMVPVSVREEYPDTP